MATVRVWGWVEYRGPGGAVARRWLAGTGPAPDLAVVDWLARAQLAARRGGGSVRLGAASPELAGLLELAGLRREVGWEPEGREGGGVEEGVEAGDPPA